MRFGWPVIEGKLPRYAGGEYRGGKLSSPDRDCPEEKAISTLPTPTELTAGINYFFAVLPDEQTRSVIAGIGERFRASHRVSGSPVGVESLHLSLCPMGKPERLQQPLESALLAAGSKVVAPGFVAALDSAMRFSAQNGQFPFVLCADGATTAAALVLRQAIAAAQLRVGLRVSGVSSFLPHVSLLHGHAVDTVEESIAPVQWQVREFVLIRSFFGESRHQVIGRWPLTTAPEPEVHDMLEEMANLPDLPDSDEE